MTWTFDPLEARNAHFNLHKLGAFSRTYRENLYGNMRDALNSGLPSDRLMAEWNLTDVARRVVPSSQTKPVAILEARSGKPHLYLDLPLAGEILSLAIPPRAQRLKQENPAVALAWRIAVRQAFSWAFVHGYVAIDFVDGAYVLVRDQYRQREEGSS